MAIGGGSAIDLAKAVALRLSHNGPLADDAAIKGGVARITDACLPVVAIPTTSGTGAEVGRASLLTLADGRKLGLISPHLIPWRALCDPTLTMKLPPVLTAATGMDAITHCIETYLGPRDNPVAEAIALDGLVRGWHHIRRAVADREDATARREMMMSSLQGGLTFQTGSGAVHSLSHPLGAVKAVNAHHGTLNAILLPFVLDHNARDAERTYRVMARLLGPPDGAALAPALSDLVAEIGLWCRLSEVGFDRDMLDAIPAAAMRDHSTATNPRSTTEEGLRDLLARAF